jgi:polar amino acid transport system substrate-binding protein
MKKRLYVLYICMSIIWPQAYAGQKSVTLGASLFPPSAYIDKSTGKCVGENIDVTSKILAHYNIKLEVVCTLPARMYILVKNSEVDFTINPKSTKALSPYVKFVEPPFKKLVINLYRYDTNSEFKTISAILGFDYNGMRQKLVDQNYQFVDLPTAESALQLFLKRRSDALVSYQSNVDHLKRQNAIMFSKEITVTPLLEVNAYYGITKGSANFDLLWHVLNDYAEQHSLEYFVPQKAD